ncbi:phage holin family protein [Planktothricoides raciborskii]|uniref:Phage holin family protein n=1 Tax=Planktothricoides raciborskii FACHB-1370 TaxID=2949576 RepID=A0ABR8EET3_9CYAN|nr:phage holin family protein [Planktothricoides raciborskii]MBD2545095.1 phage holin family protein [Planktothricoides raciborskii FACHB-1370]MBD2584249.1 phage holin family protein [Planktothricoides raciborskii FACHB-1261]
MANIIQLLIIWLVTAISFVIISKIPTGVEIDDFNKALFSAAVFGILNALVRQVIAVVTVPVLGGIFSDFLLRTLLNMIIFGLAAYLVEGFRLRWGIWSALLGSLALGFINSILLSFIPI